MALTVASAAAAKVHGSQPARASQTACATAGVATSDVRRIQKVMLCLHNLERREHGLSKLRLNRDLSNVAAQHTRDMVARHYFTHYSRGHRDHMDRIAASSYRPDTGCWTAAENLFKSATAEAPRQLLEAWMASPAHRRNILRGGWHDFGLGVVNTSPQGAPNGLTVVALYGIRTRHSCS